jgi:hypothetical protein
MITDFNFEIGSSILSEIEQSAYDEYILFICKASRLLTCEHTPQNSYVSCGVKKTKSYSGFVRGNPASCNRDVMINL